MLSSVDYNLLQPHTVALYGLEMQLGVVETLPARELLSPARFDLFAKLYYLRHREKQPDLAKRVYIEHIRCFNPDGKEPGRDDKTGFDDFLDAFSRLFDEIREHGFNPKKSLIPVGSNGVILDGAHRVAILAFLDLPATICRFDDVVSKGPFDYQYFIKRGLSLDLADLIAFEAAHWLPNLRVACLWPRMGNSPTKDMAERTLGDFFPVAYSRSFLISRQALHLLVVNVYQTQEWIGAKENDYLGAKDKAARCFALNRQIRFVFFLCGNSETVTAIKDRIRERHSFGKHTIHITDTESEATRLALLVLTEEGRKEWLYLNQFQSWSEKLYERAKEAGYFFRNILWINFKVWIAKLLQVKHEAK